MNDNLNKPKEGESSEYNPLSLDMNDEEIAEAIGNRIQDGDSFWNKELKLDDVRQTSENYWKGLCIEEDKLYPHQVPYIDPRAAISVETLVPMINSKPPQPVVIEAFDTDASKELARNIQDVLSAKYEDLFLMNKFMMVTRHLLEGLRLGVMKYTWDPEAGPLNEDGSRAGDLDVLVVRPQRITIEAEADNKHDIPLIAELQTKSIEELANMFPDKKDALLVEAGLEFGNKPSIAKRLNYHETHFSYYDKQGHKQEAIAWKYRKVILGSMKTPFWNYTEYENDEEGHRVPTNFFPHPKKPYVFFNHINSGKYVIDDNSLMDLARNQQDILNKRGRQIVENADQAGSGIVYDTDKITAATMSKLVGDPNEKIGVKGDVTTAVTRIAPNQLPNYVFNDKIDARQQIDNIFGVHAPIRGEGDTAPTLGQEMLSQRADISRTRTLATSIEDGADMLYKGMVQVMKVFYDKQRTIKFTGPEGQTSFIPFSQKSIEAGTVVRVKSGSLLPDDPVAKAERTVKMAAALDPLTIAEGMGERNPKEIASRVMLFRLAPDQYMEQVLQQNPQGAEADPSAIQEQEFMMQGQQVPPQQNPSKDHLATHDQWLNSPEFKQLPPEIQSMAAMHVKTELENSKAALGQQSDQETPPQPGAEGAPAPETPPQPNTQAQPQAKPGLLQRIFG